VRGRSEGGGGVSGILCSVLDLSRWRFIDVVLPRLFSMLEEILPVLAAADADFIKGQQGAASGLDF